MRRSVRRGVVAVVIGLGLLTLAASPALAQTERVYTGLTPPSITPPAVGAVLATSGSRPVPSQVLPLQVSGGVAATQQAPAQGLAFTGVDIATMVMVALGALTLGAVLTRRARPRSET